MEPVDALDADVGEDPEEDSEEFRVCWPAMVGRWAVLSLIFFAALSAASLAFPQLDLPRRIFFALLFSFPAACGTDMSPC